MKHATHESVTMRTYLVSVEMSELVDTEDDSVREVPAGTIRQWVINAKDENDAFDRATAYFLLGAPKTVLRSQAS